MGTEESDWGGYIPLDGEPAAGGPPPTAPPGPPPGGPRKSPLAGVPRGRIIAGVVAVAVIAVAVSQLVGGSNRPKTTTTHTATGLTKAAYIQRADTVCTQLQTKAENDYRAYAAAFQAANASAVSAAIPRFTSDAAALLAALNAIPAPTQGAPQVSRILTMYQQQITDLEAGTPGSEASIAAQDTATTMRALATQFGFRVCGVQ
jgi:hypothetical protein